MDGPQNGAPGPRGEHGGTPSRKSADAYRTIGEVAEDLKLPQHVLRFWETRFPQVRPLKRAGGRRFYRPEDVALLRAVQALLYGEGYTIKGVQRLFAEYGARQVAEALPRPAATPVDGEARPSGPDPGEGNDTAMPNDRSRGRRDPAPVPPRPTLPTAQPIGAAGPAIRADRLAALAARLDGVLIELAECNSILSTLRRSRV